MYQGLFQPNQTTKIPKYSQDNNENYQDNTRNILKI